MDNNSGSGVQSSEQSTPEEYQENQVVWAKINGYPWWPAYIGQFYQEDQIMIYTVYFFGDNSHSRISFQKLRKFQPNYKLFAAPAKKNYKLKLALRSAYEQLSQNKEDVTYFNFEKNHNKERNSKNHEKNNKFTSSNEKQDVHSENQMRNFQIKRPLLQNFNQQQQVGKADQLQQCDYVSLKQNRKRPGRPRKIINEKPDIQKQVPQSKKKQSKTKSIQRRQSEYPVQSLVKQSVENQNIHAMQLEKEQQPMVDESIQNVNEEKHAKQQQAGKEVDISQNLALEQPNFISFQKIKKQVLSSASKKQLFNILFNVQIGKELLFQLLQYNILSKLEQRITTREYMKLKQKLQKMLTNVYFNYENNNFESSKRQLIRTKVKKVIYRALKRSCRMKDFNQKQSQDQISLDHEKGKVIDFQGQMWIKFKNNKHLYMKCVLQCLSRLRVVDIGQIMQQWKQQEKKEPKNEYNDI